MDALFNCTGFGDHDAIFGLWRRRLEFLDGIECDIDVAHDAAFLPAMLEKAVDQSSPRLWFIWHGTETAHLLDRI